MNTRNLSIRSKIIALITVPLTALLALWVFATVLAAAPAVNLLSARTLLDGVGKPGEALVAELQRERRLSVVYLAGRGDGTPLANIQSSQLYEVNKFISLTGHKWECNPCIASRIAWGRLKPEDRRMVQEAAKEAAAYQRGLSQEIDTKLLGEFRANPAVAVNTVNAASMMVL